MPKQMIVDYDCEFLEDGVTIDLISIGMVREDGKEFYAVSTEFNTQKVARHEWLMNNVMPFIGYEEVTNYVNVMGTPVKDLVITDPHAMSRKQIRNGILDFVSDIWPEFWAWYGAFDHVALCQLFGSMVDLPKKFPMFTCDLKQLHKQAGNPKMPAQPEGLHNALDDARYMSVRREYLTALLDA